MSIKSSPIILFSNRQTNRQIDGQFRFIFYILLLFLYYIYIIIFLVIKRIAPLSVKQTKKKKTESIVCVKEGYVCV